MAQILTSCILLAGLAFGVPLAPKGSSVCGDNTSTTSIVADCTNGCDVVFVIDSSQGVTSDFTAELQFAKSFVQSYCDGSIASGKMARECMQKHFQRHQPCSASVG